MNWNDKRTFKKAVIQAYPSLTVKTYCTLRFVIMKMRILEEIEQYIPPRGNILDAGCGFGLFSLFFAKCSSERRFLSLDLSPHRISLAKSACSLLGLDGQVTFRKQDVLHFRPPPELDAAFTIDLLHHLPTTSVDPYLKSLHAALRPGGVLIIKDVSTRPYLKKVFTLALDRIMYPSSPPHYIHEYDLCAKLQQLGFDVKFHRLIDILPYPHVLYVCRRNDPEPKRAP